MAKDIERHAAKRVATQRCKKRIHESTRCSVAVPVSMLRRTREDLKHDLEALIVGSQEALIDAVNLGFEDVVRRQVNLGASVNEPDDEADCLRGMLPVLVAVRNRNKAMVELLLDLGAHVDGISRGDPRSRPLRVALEKNPCPIPRWMKDAELAIVQLLVERGADCSRVLRHWKIKKSKRRLRWKALRTYWRARWIGVYWHALTAKEMAPGGKAEKRDRATYEADWES